MLYQCETKIGSSVDLSERLLDGGVFDGLTLQGAYFYEASLIGASFKNADLYWADFSFAHLTGADLSGADVRGADFYKANLSQAKLLGTDFSADNLGRECDLTLTTLVGAIFDSTTKFPGNFCPIEAGCVRS